MKQHLYIAWFALALFGCEDAYEPYSPSDSAPSDYSSWSVAEKTSQPKNEQRADRSTPAPPAETPAAAKRPAADWPALEERVVELINRERAQGAQCGEYGTFDPAPPMRMNEALRQAARSHSADMARNNFFAHEGSDGSRFWDRVDRTSYRGTARGENVAGGYPSPEEAVAAWMTSDGHCMVLMLPETDEIGVGYSFDAETDHGHFWTMVTGMTQTDE